MAVSRDMEVVQLSAVPNCFRKREASAVMPAREPQTKGLKPTPRATHKASYLLTFSWCFTRSGSIGEKGRGPCKVARELAMLTSRHKGEPPSQTGKRRSAGFNRLAA